MSDRPRVAPLVLATIADQAPERVRKRLDQAPDAAHDWSWTRDGERWLIAAGNETVTLESTENRVERVEQARCSCLLSPRCFHLLACLSVLDVADGADEDEPDSLGSPHEMDSAASADAMARGDAVAAGDTSGAGEAPDVAHMTSPEASRVEPPSAGEAVTLDDEARQAAELAWQAAAAVLTVGARAAATRQQTALVRAAHECRCQGLHRLAAACLRVLSGIRELRSESDRFETPVLAADLAELATVAWRLRDARDSVEPTWLGTARREYSPQGTLKLQGVFSEAIVTRSGYAGVATYLMDGQGRWWTVSDVRPGEAERVRTAWKTGVNLGQLSLAHDRLCRSGVLLQGATGSKDGRLGSGQEVRSVSSKWDGWRGGVLDAAFRRPFAEQVRGVFSAASAPLEERRAGWDLVLFDGVALGASGRYLLVQALPNGPVLALDDRPSHDELPTRENLRWLASPGLSLRCVARIDIEAPGRGALLAAGPIPGEDPQEQHPAGTTPSAVRPEWRLPESWGGTAHVTLERLQGAHFTVGRQALTEVGGEWGVADDGLAPFRRRVDALALGGRHSLPTGTARDLAADAAALRRRRQPTAAQLLASLAAGALETREATSGVRFPADATRLAQRWLACVCYERAARLEHSQAMWLGNGE